MADHIRRLVNLTRHEATIDGAAAVIPPDGRLALVAEPVVAETPLPTDAGVLRLRTLRRSDSVAGLPAARPDVLYLVPRLTALAAEDRDDLVFPLGERRDDRNRIIGVRALGRFDSRRRRRRESTHDRGGDRTLARGFHVAA